MITAPIAINEFNKSGGKRVFNKNKVAFGPGSFYTEQRHQFRSAMQSSAGIRHEAENNSFL